MQEAQQAALLDDNLPPPENIPRNIDEGLDSDSADPMKAKPTWLDGLTWDHRPAVCPRAVQGIEELEPKLLNYEGPTENGQPTRSGIFWHFTPIGWWRKVVDWSRDDDSGFVTTVNELKLYWALRRLMACYPGHHVRDWFSSKRRGVKGSAPFKLNVFMSGNRFKKISSSLRFSDGAPSVPNKFHEEMPKDKAWNENMQASYRPGTDLTPDESMMRWLHRMACPGWVCCPRKPWEFGRERHTVADKARVIIAFETVMGKDTPIGHKQKFDEYGGGVTSLVMRLLGPWHNSGRRIWLDSGFCVLLLVALLSTVGLFANAQIKKRRYWPRFLPIADIEAQLETMSVGDYGVHEGKFLGKPIFIIYLKDEKYNSLHMAGHCPSSRSGKVQKRCSNTISFQYPWNIASYYK